MDDDSGESIERDNETSVRGAGYRKTDETDGKIRKLIPETRRSISEKAICDCQRCGREG